MGLLEIFDTEAKLDTYVSGRECTGKMKKNVNIFQIIMQTTIHKQLYI